MYRNFFSLKEKPFNLTPDPRYLYLNLNHREVLASLKYGIVEKRGFIVITGEVGTGKTTHLFNFLEQLGEEAVSAFIFNPILTQQEFFQYIFEDFNLSSGAKTKTEFLVGLNKFLLQQAEKGVTTVLVIDEAQNLSREILEEVRLLSNLETPREKLLQIVLVGQPELDEKLRSLTLRQLRQRISIRCRIQPLSAEETGDYIRHRLKVAGFAGEEEIFDPEVVALIARLSSGIPRVVNNICDNVLISCYALGRTKADRSIVLEVAEDLDLDTRVEQVVESAGAAVPEPDEIGLRVVENSGPESALPETEIVRSTGRGAVADQYRKGADRTESGPLPPNSWERSMKFFQSFIDRLKLENE